MEYPHQIVVNNVTTVRRIGEFRIGVTGAIKKLDIVFDSPIGVGGVGIQMFLNGVSVGTYTALEGATSITQALNTNVMALDKVEFYTTTIPTGGTGIVTCQLKVIDAQELLQDSTRTLITGNIASVAEEYGTVLLGKFGLISIVGASYESRVTLYLNEDYRTADAARAIGTDPIGEHGVLLDAVLTASNLTLDLSPVASYRDGKTTKDGNICYRVQNRSGSSRVITVTFTYTALY